MILCMWLVIVIYAAIRIFGAYRDHVTQSELILRFRRRTTSTIQVLTPITGPWSGNFLGNFDGKRKKFGVMDAKLIIL